MSYISAAFIAILALLLIREEYRQIKKLNKVNYLINTYEHDLENPKLIDEMYEFCWQDRKLKKVMKKYQPTKEDFNRLYHRLLVWGNFRKYHRFVPISSFFAVYPLEYLLTHQDLDDKALNMRMMNFFHF